MKDKPIPYRLPLDEVAELVGPSRVVVVDEQGDREVLDLADVAPEGWES